MSVKSAEIYSAFHCRTKTAIPVELEGLICGEILFHPETDAKEGGGSLIT